MAPSPVELALGYKGGSEDSPLLDKLSFGQAFRAARNYGVDKFRWRGKLYTTQLTEEVKGASQTALKQTPAGAGMATSPDKELESRSLLSSAPEYFEETLELIKALLTLDERNPAIPESLKKVAKEYKAAANISESFPGGGRAPEADTFRHVEGARRASTEAGILPTLVGSTAHELQNLLTVAKAKVASDTAPVSATGQPITFQQALGESAKDIKNNLLGIYQGGLKPGLNMLLGKAEGA